MIEKILRRKDGSRVKIRCRVYSDFGSRVTYSWDVSTCGYKKRTFNDTLDPSDYEYRLLGVEGKAKWKIEKALEHVTPDEIHSVMLELWQTLKPKAFDIGSY